MNKPLHILGHLDMGDAIVLNGLVHSLCVKEDAITWYVKPSYVPAVAKMMAHVPKISVQPAGGGYESPKAEWLDPSLRTLRLGIFSSGRFDFARWDWEFYRQAGIRFSARWDRFFINPDLMPAGVRQKKDFVLVHEDPARGFYLRPEKLPAGAEVVRVLPGRETIWDWLPEIYQAREIHVIDSCVLNLIESLRGVTAKLYFHRYARPRIVDGANYPTLFGPWNVID